MRTSGYINGEERQPLLAQRPSAAKPATPPNGGLEAWLTVLAGFFIFVNSW